MKSLTHVSTYLKQLHRIGLRIEEIQGDIMARLKHVKTKKPTVVKL